MSSPGRTRRILASVAVLTLAAALCGCADVSDDSGPSGSGNGSADPSGSAPHPAAVAPSGASGGWTLTVYYTAVEKYHTGKATAVTGCPTINCSRGRADLGTYPEDFVTAVHDEGTGRTNAGSYLNWSSDTGYWLDSAPRDSASRPLRPFESAAADATVLPDGARFTVLECGHDSDRAPIDPAVCAKLRSSRWMVTDEFTPGLGGPHHIDLYLGEETGPGFTDGPWYTTGVDARLQFG